MDNTPEEIWHQGSPMSSRSVSFGWGAPKFAEQFPELSADVAAHFDADNAAIIRLHLRGAITDTQRNQAIEKTKKKIIASLSSARGETP